MAQVKFVDLEQLPPSEQFLSEREQAFLQTLKFPKRRSEWLGGRFALKALVSVAQQVELYQAELLPQANSGKPDLYICGQKSALAFSITHSHGFAAAAIAPRHKFIGIDLEKIAPRINAWKENFFHPNELTGAGDAFLTALWTQKEAAVKLLGTGLTVNSFDVRCVGGKVSFYGRAQEIYQALGSPQIALTTQFEPEGFCFSIAVGA
jgi:4'-phosphopantetheinyl transferase